MRLSLFKIFVVVALAFIIAFVAAPWFAFRALKAGAEAEDIAAIAQIVDFPAVRKSLTAQLAPQSAAATPEAPSLWTDPLGAMRRALEPLAPPEPKVDAYLTAEGLGDLTRGYAPGEAPAASPPPKGLSQKVRRAVSGPFPTYDYFGTERARIAVDRPGAKGEETIFTFERKATFTWKLVHIQLPKDER